MNVKNKATVFKRAMVLAAVLAMAGNSWAKNGNSGISADLSPDRTQVTVGIDELAACNPLTTTATLSVYIFQSVGRLINIGTYSASVPCTNVATPAGDITVTAIPGLTFQPGPATLLIRYTTTDTATTQQTNSESGARLNLHP